MADNQKPKKNQSQERISAGARPVDSHPESSLSPQERPDDQRPLEVDLMAEAGRETGVATAVDAASGALTDAEEAEKKMAYYEASQWQLMRRRFRKHKMAFWMFHVLLVLYIICLNCEFFSPYNYEQIHADSVYQPPQVLRFGSTGGTLPGFYVHPFKMEQHPVTLDQRYYVDYERRVPIKLFSRGFSYNLFGFIPTNLHFFGTSDTRPVLTEGSNGSGLEVSFSRTKPASADESPSAESPAEATESTIETAGDVLRYIQVDNVDLFASSVKRNDVLRVFYQAEDGRESLQRDFRIRGVVNNHVAELQDTPGDVPPEGARFEIHRPERAFLLGTDGLGRDMLSRLVTGGRISLLLGITGVLLSFFLGISFGGISGYYGGWIDMGIQRMAEILQSIPKIPIWLALGAAIPRGWSPVQVYFGMTLILACMGWTGLCRVVRGKLLSLREEDYARAALLAGATERRVIFMHLIPNFTSHIIASLTLAIPGMIMAETSLSFLGLGLRPPIVSWGVLLQQANSVAVVKQQPWLLLPAVMVIIAVLSFNFIGEGLRDAADPYSS